MNVFRNLPLGKWNQINLKMDLIAMEMLPVQMVTISTRTIPAPAPETALFICRFLFAPYFQKNKPTQKKSGQTFCKTNAINF